MKVTTCVARFTRPTDTTAYTDGDIVANSTVAGSVLPLTFEDAVRGIVRRAILSKSTTGMTAPIFRLHLFSRGSLTFANGDNAAMSVNGAASYLGYLDCTIGRVFTDGAAGVFVPGSGQGAYLNVPGNSKVYGVLEAKGAYAPGNAEVFTVALEIEEQE